MPFNLTTRRQTSFVLWIPTDEPSIPPTPRLVLGKWSVQQNQFEELVNEPLVPAQGVSGLWELSCASVASKLLSSSNQKAGPYIYWFQVQDTSPADLGFIHVTDPLAYALDYRSVKDPGNQPAAVIWVDLESKELFPCDAGAEKHARGPPESPPVSNMPRNDHLTIYEVPTSFTRGSSRGEQAVETDIGTFGDVITLLETPADPKSAAAPQIHNKTYLQALGINALELTPPADAKPPKADGTGSRQQWGYATANYHAPDYQLGYKDQNSTAVRDLSSLTQTCHENGIRFFADMVMAFGHDPYQNIAYQQFHLNPKKEPYNDDSYQSDRPRNRDNMRDGWGGESWRYIKITSTYDPESGTDKADVCPASSFHLAHVERWISYYQIDGIRLDSIENVANRNFLSRICKKSHQYFAERNPNLSKSEQQARFMVVGEELSTPQDLISSGTLDGYWNEEFKKGLRAAILGYTYGGDNFDWTVRKVVDCRAMDRGFARGTQSVLYITSHDTGGDAINQRLYNYLARNGVGDKKPRVKLAFAILLTSIGMPMIYAGEEFCDEQDRVAEHPFKQVDPVNYGRLLHSDAGWRWELFEYVSRLVKFRTESDALSGDSVDFMHWDFSGDRKIMAWVRGGGETLPVVVVANFSGVKPEGDKYEIARLISMAERVGGKEVKWRDVGQGRKIDAEWVGREPLFPWEAKVYACSLE
jgi:pullulanase